MTIRRLLAAFAALVLAPVLLGVVGTSPAAASPSSAAAAAVRTIRYDASRAAEFRAAVDQGAQIWNNHVSNVRFVPGTPADVVVHADNGWPRAQLRSLGRGTVWMGRTAVWQGYDEVRIAAHELGHILGLPDRRTGRCTDLMSGSSAPTSCRNPNPSAAEAAEVERNFQYGLTGAAAGTTLTEAPARAGR